jgi:methylenetetrahydrofolate dehydrogenase (NADP+)/methenyltetrahydrofolate cyclohydrolase
MNLLDGKLVSEKIKAEIATEVKTKMLDAGKDAPHLAAILIGEDPPSQTYVAAKEKDCKEVGFISSVYRYNANISQEKLLEVIDF